MYANVNRIEYQADQRWQKERQGSKLSSLEVEVGGVAQRLPLEIGDVNAVVDECCSGRQDEGREGQVRHTDDATRAEVEVKRTGYERSVEDDDNAGSPSMK